MSGSLIPAALFYCQRLVLVFQPWLFPIFQPCQNQMMAGSLIPAALFHCQRLVLVFQPWLFPCVSAMAGSCVSATEWVTGSCVSATFCETDGVTVSGASDFCVAAPMVRIGKGSGVGKINSLRGFSRIGGGFRVVVSQGGLNEGFVRFLRGKGGKDAICGRFRGGFSSMIGQGVFSGSESSIII
jgi:hypothetical protein